MLFQLFRKNRITEGDPVDLKLESHREPSFSNTMPAISATAFMSLTADTDMRMRRRRC